MPFVFSFVVLSFCLFFFLLPVALRLHDPSPNIFQDMDLLTDQEIHDGLIAYQREHPDDATWTMRNCVVYFLFGVSDFQGRLMSFVLVRLPSSTFVSSLCA